MHGDLELLEVKDLKIEFYDHSVPEVAVRDVDFTMEDGEIIGLVGESGSGKSLTASAIAGLIRRGDVKVSGEILWNDDDKELNLLKISRTEMRRLQGDDIGFIFQNPMTAFSPVHKIGYQVEDALRVHDGKNISKEEMKKRAIDALRAAELPDPERVYSSYPFELSGGMRQRAMIASAMISSPRLLIADEPTTALDVTVQAEIIKLLKRINEKDHTAILFISHDLGLVRKLCQKVIVLKNGDVIETGDVEEIFSNPKGDYTKKLIAANLVMERKTSAESDAGSHRTDDAQAPGETDDKAEKADAHEKQEEVECSVKNLTYLYPVRNSILSLKKNKEKPAERIGIHDINLTIKKGEIVGLVGESGSGKSTLAKCIAGLTGDFSETIKKNKVGMIFQDSYSALNPKRSIDWLLREALYLNGVKEKDEQDERIKKILLEVEIPEDFREKYPSMLSGGQRQRVMIAMALLQEPTLLIADEPVSALDVAIQESILKLLKNLSKKHCVAILFISHDLRTVYDLCDFVAVMKGGRIVEAKKKDELYSNPEEEYTKVLLRSALE